MPPSGYWPDETYLQAANRLIKDFPIQDEGVLILKDLQEEAKDFDSLDPALGDDDQLKEVQ